MWGVKYEKSVIVKWNATIFDQFCEWAQKWNEKKDEIKGKKLCDVQTPTTQSFADWNYSDRVYTHAAVWCDWNSIYIDPKSQWWHKVTWGYDDDVMT